MFNFVSKSMNNRIIQTFIGIILFIFGYPVADAQIVAPDLEYYIYDKASDIPSLLFAQEPEFNSVALSPDGKHILYIYPNDSKYIFRIDSIDNEFDTEKHYIGAVSKSLFSKINWVSKSRLILEINTVTDIDFTYTRKNLGFNFTITKMLFAFDVNGKALDKIFEYKFVANPQLLTSFQSFQSLIVDTFDSDENNILVSLLVGEDAFPSIHYLNVYTGETQIVQEAMPFITNWYTDHEGKVRFGTGSNDGELIMIARRSDDKEWINLDDQELFKDDRFKPVSFGENENSFFVISPAANGRYSVYDFDIAEGVLKRKIFEHPNVDVSSIEFSKKDKTLLAITFQEDKLERYFVDAAYKKTMDAVDKALPDRSNFVISITDDQRYMLIKSESDVFPGAYYRMDIKRKILYMLGELNTTLNPKYLSPQISKIYFARDGLEIPSFLTLPKAANSTGKLPLVVIPHSLPNGRDLNRYNFLTQFLVSRGYAVFQPNYRGSSGYGLQFQMMGYGEWGRNIQNDIVDGVQSLISEGIVDENRICIMGQNFGGYIALMSSIQNQDMYRCVITNAPITDLSELIKTIKNNYGKTAVQRIIGDRKKRDVRKVSPIQNIKNINTPLLLFHGNMNDKIPIKYNESFLKKLKKNKIPYKFVVLKNEGNEILTYENRIIYLNELESFLNIHLKAGTNLTELEAVIE